jgi:pyridoxine 4-dehydrogenase
MSTFAGAISILSLVYFASTQAYVIPVAKLSKTQLGTLTVPTVGIGTIAWTSSSCTCDAFGSIVLVQHSPLTSHNHRTVTRLENSELQSLVDVACQSNAAFFDTAERYGSNLKTALGLGWGETEKLTRHLLKESPTCGAGAVIATKFTPSPWRTTVQSVIDACEDSRRRLGVEQIDLYQLHMPDIVQPFNKLVPRTTKAKDEIYWEGLAECYNRGLVKNVGVCNYGPTLLRRCQDALAARNVPLASNQIAYSLLGRHNGAQETVDFCNVSGIKVLAFFPFAMGLLTGKYTATGTGESQHAINSLLTSKKTILEARDLQRYADKIEPLLLVMQGIATNRRRTVSQVALNYIICKGAIPIPGARTRQQLEDNLGSMQWRLSDTEIALLEQAADQLGFGFDGAGFKRASEKFVGYGMEKWTLD